MCYKYFTANEWNFTIRKNVMKEKKNGYFQFWFSLKLLAFLAEINQKSNQVKQNEELIESKHSLFPIHFSAIILFKTTSTLPLILDMKIKGLKDVIILLIVDIIEIYLFKLLRFGFSFFNIFFNKFFIQLINNFEEYLYEFLQLILALI